MKKLLILLLINLLVPIQSSSQITLDSIEAKTTAIIFAEHEKFLIENSLLKEQVNSLEKLNNLYIKSDSLQNEKILLYKDSIINNNIEIQKIKLSKQNLVINSVIGCIITFLIGLIL